jgi:hypothetical protein
MFIIKIILIIFTVIALLGAIQERKISGSSLIVFSWLVLNLLYLIFS